MRQEQSGEPRPAGYVASAPIQRPAVGERVMERGHTRLRVILLRWMLLLSTEKIDQKAKRVRERFTKLYAELTKSQK